MKLLCLALLVLVAHQAHTNPTTRVKHQHSVRNPVPKEYINVKLRRIGHNPEATTENLEATTRKPWFKEPRHEKIASRREISTDYNQLNRCKEGEFQCDDDLCVSEEKRCDGRVNCKDGTDEDDCDQVEKFIDTKMKLARQAYGRPSLPSKRHHPLVNIGPAPECPSPWVLLGNECFLVVTGWRTWQSARTYCAEQANGAHGDLAIPNDRQALVDHINNVYGPRFWYYLGGSYLDREGVWRWVNFDDMDLTQGWQSGEPNNYGGGENCLAILPERGADTLHDVSCDLTRRFVCERGCGGTFTHPIGTINYPSGGGNYPNYADCSWVINVETPIHFTFTRFQLETNYDFLEIWDGSISTSGAIGLLTGHTLPPPIETSVNAAYLHFTSDYSVTFSGFEIHWAPLGCGGTYTTSNGVIKYPLNGGNYVNNEDCVWKINAAEPIKITFPTFDLEYDFDFLYIRNGPSSDSPLLGSFTGFRSYRVHTTQNYAFIHFVSDRSITKTGFELRWEPASTTGRSDSE